MKKFINSILSLFSKKKKDAPFKNDTRKATDVIITTSEKIAKTKEEDMIQEPIKAKVESASNPPIKEVILEPKPEIVPEPLPDPVKEEALLFPIQDMLAYADRQIGAPYLIGGTTPDAFDCSGFVGYVFKEFNIDLPRTSSMQAETGQNIDLSEVKKGDLVFFSHTGDKIQHVGIITSEEGKPLSMIHASTSKGVIHSDLENSVYWKPRIKWAKRVIIDTVS